MPGRSNMLVSSRLLDQSDRYASMVPKFQAFPRDGFGNLAQVSCMRSSKPPCLMEVPVSLARRARELCRDPELGTVNRPGSIQRRQSISNPRLSLVCVSSYVAMSVRAQDAQCMEYLRWLEKARRSYGRLYSRTRCEPGLRFFGTG